MSLKGNDLGFMISWITETPKYYVTNKPQKEWWQMSAKERRQNEVARNGQREVLPED
jgi:hypothetical protein